MKTAFTRVGFLAILILFSYQAGAFYDPNVGRWISRDPIQERGGKNLYGFVGNQPTKYVDKNGAEYIDDGYIMVFSTPGYGAVTRSTFDLELRPQTLSYCKCNIKVDKFKVRTKSYIAQYQVFNYQEYPFPRYSDDQISRNTSHEQRHRTYDANWHNEKLPEINSDAAVPFPCAQTSYKVNELILKYRSKWNDYYAGEVLHTNPWWSDFEMTPAEFNPDQETWWNAEPPEGSNHDEPLPFP